MLINNAFVQRTQAIWVVVAFELGMNPDCAFVPTAFQVINGSENGHVTTKPWCEIGNHPMDVQGLWVDVALQRPFWKKSLGFELDDLLKSLNFELIFPFNN